MKCGKTVSEKDFHVDHIVPLAKGGAEFDLTNLELSCPKCNLKKGAKLERQIVKTEKWCIGFIAYCEDCDWQSENYQEAQIEARTHAKKHRHSVHCEQTIAIDYDGSSVIF